MSAGTIKLVNGSTQVVGTDTTFTKDLGLHDQIVVKINGVQYALSVQSVTTDTQLVLNRPFDGPTTDSVSYTAVPYDTLVAVTMQMAADVNYTMRARVAEMSNWYKLLTLDADVTIDLPNNGKFTGASWPKILRIAEASDLSKIQPIADQIRDDSQQVATDRQVVEAAAASTANNAAAAATSEQNAANSEVAAAASAGAAKSSETNSAASESNAKTSEQNAKTSETNAKTSETNAKSSEQKSATSEANSKASELASAQSEANSATSETNAAASNASAHTAQVAAEDARDKAIEAKAGIELARDEAAASAESSAASATESKNQADRAEAEADKIAAQNQLINAINSVGPAPGYRVDFISMPSVNGVKITEALESGGFQINSKDICDDGTTNNMGDDAFSGRSFLVTKPLIEEGVSKNGAPVNMQKDKALCVDTYVTWTPEGQSNPTNTRIQIIYDTSINWIREYSATQGIWGTWKSQDVQLYQDVTGMDLNDIVQTGTYTFTTAVNAPVIHGDEASSIYYLSVEANIDRSYVVQQLSSPKTNSHFHRYLADGQWSRWWNTTATFDVDTAPAGFSYDETVNPGWWGVDNSTATGMPSALASEKVMVQVAGTADGSTFQTIYSTKSSSRYIRFKDQTGTWGAWRQILTTDLNGVVKGIRKIEGLTGPLTLGGDAVTPYDAVTLRQLQSVSGGGGANMNGVMNNFIGCVEWFQGSRANLPPGYVAADGQEESRTDPKTADLWAAVDSGFLVSVSEALWQNAGGTDFQTILNRGKYSTGNGTTTFRVPDLNGVDTITPSASFLRGSGKGANGNPGDMFINGAPNITAQFKSRAVQFADGGLGSQLVEGSGAVSISAKTGPSYVPVAAGTGGPVSDVISLDASKSNAVWGRSGEVRPNAVTGIWIIRASGAFEAAGTNFNVINSDETLPGNGTVVRGGTLRSVYEAGGKTQAAASLQVKATVGGAVVPEISAENSVGSVTGWTLPVGGGELLTMSQLGSSATLDAQGSYLDSNQNKVMKVGAFGLGGTGQSVTVGEASLVTLLRGGVSQIYRNNLPTAYGYSYSPSILLCSADTWSNICVGYNNTGIKMSCGLNDGSSTSIYTIYTDKNTTRASDGTLKAASPVARIIKSREETKRTDVCEEGFNWCGAGTCNSEAIGIELSRLDVGVYKLVGSLGLAKEGWRLLPPRDPEGGTDLGIVEAEETETEITIRLYKRKYILNDEGEIELTKGNLIDVPENSWIDVRLDMPENVERDIIFEG